MESTTRVLRVEICTYLVYFFHLSLSPSTLPSPSLLLPPSTPLSLLPADLEAMEVERWGEQNEVAMDIDVSEEDIAEMKFVRSTDSFSSELNMKSFGIPADYTNDFSVRAP